MTRPGSLTVLVDLEVLIAPEQEAPTTRAIRASVSSAVGSAVLGPAGWAETAGGEELVERWRLDQRGAPLAGRRVRLSTMSVRADDGDDVFEEVRWAAIGAVCPTARDEDRRTDAGESVTPNADELPWSSRTHVADEVDDADEE